MEEIKLYIISSENNDISNNKNKNNHKKELKIKIEGEKEDLYLIETIKKEYQIWIKDLIILMNSQSYRKALNEIEKNKNKFQLLDIRELWKYKIIKLKAILRIIKRKLGKYKSEINRDNSHQNKSIQFWFNQAYFIFEELINDFDPENNNNIDISSIDIIKPIQAIIEKYLEFFYLIIMLYKQKNEIVKICAYLSLVDNFMPYISYLTNFNSIFFLQKLLLFRSKISLQNRNYIISLKYQKIVIKLCIRILLFISNFYKGLDNFDEDKSITNSFIKKIYKIFVNFILSFYLRGVACEEIGNINKAIRCYIFCKWIYLKFLVDDNELFGMFISKLENNSISHIQIANDIKEIFEKRKRLNKNKYENINSIKIIKGLDKMNQLFKIKYPSLNNNNNINKYIKKIEINNRAEKNQTEKLETYLEKIGNKLYKEEESRNNNLLKKYTKSKYIISTMTMIDNLLSKDFRNIVLKMDKIEITKPSNDITNLINKIIVHKRRRLLFNSNLLNNKRTKSAMNINKGINENNGVNLKSSLVKNEIDMNIKNKFNMLINNRKSNFNLNKSAPININNIENRNTNYIFNKIYNKNKDSISQSILNYNNKNNLANNNSIKGFQKNLSTQYIVNNKLTKNFSNKSKMKKSNISSSQKVIKYNFDKYDFSKSYLKKKDYIDKYFDREIDFHKKLLNSKKYENKNISDIEMFNTKNARISAERDYNIIFNVQNRNYQKDMSSLLNIKQLRIINEKNKSKKQVPKEENDIITLKMEKDMINARKKKQRRKGIVEINRKKLIWLNNEGKMKKLTAECDEISHREKKIKRQRRRILLKISQGKYD